VVFDVHADYLLCGQILGCFLESLECVNELVATRLVLLQLFEVVGLGPRLEELKRLHVGITPIDFLGESFIDVVENLGRGQRILVVLLVGQLYRFYQCFFFFFLLLQQEVRSSKEEDQKAYLLDVRSCEVKGLHFHS